MPRFFFDLNDDGQTYRDEVGEDLESFEEARAQCQAMLPDMVREKLPDGDLHSVTCNVRDETGRVVYRGQVTYRGERDPEGRG